ncbi:MAG: ammonium transporter [Acidimicrobiia bacterium]|nr:ammonium transporter [Acidimicrobiia bacterium]
MRIDAANTAWVLVSAALVMFMTPGLAFFYGGMVRAKNVLAMLAQNFFSLGLVSILWVALCFSLVFGGTGGLLGNLDLAWMRGLDTALPGYTGAAALTIPAPVFMSYQMMFAVITPALITGAVADRIRFSAWVWFLGLWLVFVYSPVARWVFSPEGWLFRRGALDFAGGTVVHVNAGIAALAAVLVLGRRRGWPERAMPPHSLPLTLIGTGILWFGWFGFNAGSALGAGELAGRAFLNTHLAAAAALIGWLAVERLRTGHATTLGAASGAVAGLVAITPCAGFVGGMAPVYIGLIAGAVCYFAVSLKFRFGFDDALDVIGVHLVGGLVGSLLLGFFADRTVNAAARDGVFLGGGWGLFGEQVLAVVVTIVWSFVLTYAICRILDVALPGGIRASEDDEETGLDLSQHSEVAYAGDRA